MTDLTNELRRLAQAATPGPWKLLPVGDKWKCFAVADINLLSVLTVVDECGTSFGAVYLDGDAKFIAAANPAAVSELLDRLEAAEKERDALRARIEALERQEPVAWLHETRPDSGVVTDTVKRVWEEAVVGSLSAYSIPLCIATGAQPAPSLPDTHNDMVVGLDYQGAMSCARQRAKKEAELLYPEGDARKEEKERELASEYCRQYTTPNPEAKP